MNHSSAFTRSLLVALAGVGTAGWLLAEPPIDPARHPDRTTEVPGISNPRSPSGATSSAAEAAARPSQVNKASSLIGMEVKNAKGESLGRIRDLVVNLEDAKVAYCVLGVEDGLLRREKYHAVPLIAFQPGEGGMFLTLHADKDKLARAEGFDRDQWPSVENPAWGAEAFWTEPSKPESEVLRDTLGTDPGTSIPTEPRKDPATTDPERPTPPAP